MKYTVDIHTDNQEIISEEFLTLHLALLWIRDKRLNLALHNTEIKEIHIVS